MNKIKTSEPKPLWKIRCTLGEGTLWVSDCLLYTSPSPRD